MIKVLFICHGNICRSPMAEFWFRHLVEQAGLSNEIDEYSCAMKSHFRKSGNQMSGKWKSSYASLLA